MPTRKKVRDAWNWRKPRRKLRAASMSPEDERALIDAALAEKAAAQCPPRHADGSLVWRSGAGAFTTYEDDSKPGRNPRGVRR